MDFVKLFQDASSNVGKVSDTGNSGQGNQGSAQVNEEKLGEMLKGSGSLSDAIGNEVLNNTSKDYLDIVYEILDKAQGKVNTLNDVIDNFRKPSVEDHREAANEENDAEIFTNSEADAYVKGEAEIDKQVEEAKEANKDNPDFDAEQAEKEIRESYAIMHPEYAEVMEEGQKVEKEHDEAMKAKFDEYTENNPEPKAEDYDNAEEYEAAVKEWAAGAQEEMDKAESAYIANNPNYASLYEAKNSSIELLPNWKIPIELDPGDGKWGKPEIIEPGDGKWQKPEIIAPGAWDDPGFWKKPDIWTDNNPEIRKPDFWLAAESNGYLSRDLITNNPQIKDIVNSGVIQGHPELAEIFQKYGLINLE